MSDLPGFLSPPERVLPFFQRLFSYPEGLLWIAVREQPDRKKAVTGIGVDGRITGAQREGLFRGEQGFPQNLPGLGVMDENSSRADKMSNVGQIFSALHV